MSQRSLHRRAFAQKLAVGALAPAALPAITAVSNESAAVAGEQQADAEKPAAEAAPPEPSRLVLQLIERNYPADFTEEQRAEIHSQVERQLARSQILSGFPLKNGDEPAPIFSAWRAD